MIDAPDRIWAMPDKRLMWTEEDKGHESATPYIRADLCASGQQVRALNRAVGEDRKAWWTLPVGDPATVSGWKARAEEAEAALEARDREKVREGMQRAVDLYPQGIAAILAAMEKEGGE
ncbi:hypothetical protein E3U26_12325 [Paracoccus ferrooxidans]|nr:hypothetical protein E3U26_12325 [Paracoccus ferrooxidans]